MRWGVLAVVLGACGSQPAMPPPRLAQPIYPETYYTRLANLRTTLARADIPLKVAGMDETFTTKAGARCELAGQMTAIDGALLDAATHAFSLYPTQILVRSGVKYVALCRDITDAGDMDHPAGLADTSDDGMLISVRYFLGRTYYSDADFTVDDIVHHEMFHLIEAAYEHAYSSSRDPEWLLYNPLGFEYSTDHYKNADPRQAGFVSTYAMSSSTEDKASVYGYMMARSLDLCELAKDDEVIHQKAHIIWTRLLQTVGSDQFLRDHSPCIDWLRWEGEAELKAERVLEPKLPGPRHTWKSE